MRATGVAGLPSSRKSAVGSDNQFCSSSKTAGVERLTFACLVGTRVTGTVHGYEPTEWISMFIRKLSCLVRTRVTDTVRGYDPTEWISMLIRKMRLQHPVMVTISETQLWLCFKCHG